MRIPERPPNFSKKDVVRGVLESNADPNAKATIIDALLYGNSPFKQTPYLHWDELRRKTVSAGLTHETWWFLLKLKRSATYQKIPILDPTGKPFIIANDPEIQRSLHRIDRQVPSESIAEANLTTPESNDRFLIATLQDEAITSSQMEGAATTTRIAKEMLRSGREPRDRDEQMIVNNYRAMRRIRELAKEPLSLELILEIHEIITEKTLKNAADAGRLRADDDNIHIVDEYNETLYVPPAAKELPERMQVFCDFANAIDEEPFLHPVVRAILIHFGLAINHPFVDGNGRTARALFYWHMLRSRYSLFEHLSISGVIKTSSAQYARAFLYAETDDNDATYFVIYHLKTILRAIDRFSEYTKTKQKELHHAESILKKSADLNYRQKTLLANALRNPDTEYVIESHARSHDVSYQTARNDFVDLEKRKFLKKRRRGKSWIFIRGIEIDRALEKM
ncbi:MAG: Fic family protein [Planctomycetota bacterium]